MKPGAAFHSECQKSVWLVVQFSTVDRKRINEVTRFHFLKSEKGTQEYRYTIPTANK